MARRAPTSNSINRWQDELAARLRGWWFRTVFDGWTCALIERWRPARNTGARGERLAERLLRGQGMITVARNFHSSRGELDLVMVDRRQVVFVEVKTWHRARAGESPADAVDDNKQRALAFAAIDFLQQHRLIDQSCRFDVVAIELATSPPKLRHFRAAFESPLDW